MRYTVAAQSSHNVRLSLQRRYSGLTAPLSTGGDHAISRGRICCPTSQTLKAAFCLQAQSGHFRNTSDVASSCRLKTCRSEDHSCGWLMNSEKLRLSNSCRSSSVVEQLIADQKVIGSNPMIDFMRAVYCAMSCTYHRFGMHI